tara:strand:- start:422 stop:1264 length:843 start_codon:yes stop_codon:yes gene_type:complete
MALTKVGKEGITGIDNSSDATAITINSSETVMIGRTSTGYSNTGAQFTASGAQNILVADGDYALGLGRNTSDGTIQEFRKDNTAIGKIGSDGSDLFIESSVSNHAGLRFAGGSVLPRYNGSLADNAVDLGQASTDYRFKDIYLSGGVRVGGTGTANLLDDYEEGTFTPAYSQSSANSVQLGKYTKVGNMVIINIRLQVTQTSSTTALGKITGLPFTIHDNCSHLTINTREFSTTGKHLHANLNPSTTESFTFTDASNGSTFGAGSQISFGLTFAYAIQGS